MCDRDFSQASSQLRGGEGVVNLPFERGHGGKGVCVPSVPKGLLHCCRKLSLHTRRPGRLCSSPGSHDPSGKQSLALLGESRGAGLVPQFPSMLVQFPPWPLILSPLTTHLLILGVDQGQRWFSCILSCRDRTQALGFTGFHVLLDIDAVTQYPVKVTQ